MKLKAKKSDFPMSQTIELGYCELQNLLAKFSPIAYTSGLYGWNADIYQFGDYYICTGYRPFGKINPDYKTVQEYNKKADELRKKSIRVNLNNKTINEKKAFNALIYKFIQDVTKAV